MTHSLHGRGVKAKHPVRTVTQIVFSNAVWATELAIALKPMGGIT